MAALPLSKSRQWNAESIYFSFKISEKKEYFNVSFDKKEDYSHQSLLKLENNKGGYIFKASTEVKWFPSL